jgi:hypothetical protein
MAVCMSICRALLLVGGLGSTARTQTVRASLVDRESGAPIVSAMVSLRDSADRAIDLGLTDKRGHVRLASRTPGQFTLAVQRIGRIDTPVATLVPAAEVLTAVSMRAGHPFHDRRLG